MEKVSDFFSELKARLSNPLILSYLIAWCAWNYKIIVGLVFYKQRELKLDGYDSFIDLIRCESSTEHFLIYPISIAIAYVIAFPVVKNLILAWGVFSDTWGGNLNIRLGKTQNVPIETHLLIEEKYKKALERAVKYAVEEKNYVNSISELDERVINLQSAVEIATLQKTDRENELNSLLLEKEKELRRWNNFNSSKVLEGNWVFTETTFVIAPNKPREAVETKRNAAISENLIFLKDELQNESILHIDEVMSNFKSLKVTLGLSSGLPKDSYDSWTFSLKDPGEKINVLSGLSSTGSSIRLIRRSTITDDPAIVQP